MYLRNECVILSSLLFHSSITHKLIVRWQSSSRASIHGFDVKIKISEIFKLLSTHKISILNKLIIHIANPFEKC
jgi:hypothetical protein